MVNLPEPKLTKISNTNLVKKFHDICNGLTLVALYGILWLLIGAFGYRLFIWIF